MKNLGWQTWDSHAVPSPVLVSYHWADQRGRTLVFEGIRTALPSVVRSGEVAALTVNIVAPPDTGRRRLVLDLVHEGTTWFSEQGCATGSVWVDIA